MYIVAIAWLYVTILMAATEATLVAGLMTLIFYGVAPLALFLWLFGTPRRRHRQRLAEKEEGEVPVEPKEDPVEEPKS
jgi:hypothetical protein